jgi:hypothetical protein
MQGQPSQKLGSPCPDGIQAARGRKEGFYCDAAPSIGTLDDCIHNCIYGAWGVSFVTLRHDDLRR